jgi:hypothetical protein
VGEAIPVKVMEIASGLSPLAMTDNDFVY